MKRQLYATSVSCLSFIVITMACNDVEMASVVDDNPHGSLPDARAALPFKVGEVHALDAAILDRADDGSYTQRIHVPGATFIKLHFQGLSLEPEEQLVIADANGTLVHRLHNGDLGSDGWTPSIMGDAAMVTLHPAPNSVPRAFSIDRYARGTVDVFGMHYAAELNHQRTICGADDKLPAACFGGTMFANARAVGRMLFISDGLLFACTGWLASNQDHFLTNNHCIKTQAEADTLDTWFNFEATDCGGTTPATPTVVHGATLLATSQPLDYTLLRLPGSPAATFGFLRIDPRDLEIGYPFYIPQHPQGDRKQVALSEGGTICTVKRNEQSLSSFAARANIGYTCDTEGGSSGSPVISANTQQVVALHHLGGSCGSTLNAGTYMRDIYPQISGFLLPPGIRPFYRMNNDSLGDHLYTAFSGERDNAKSAFGYVNEGLAGYVFADPAADRVPFYRLYHSGSTDHLYTTSAAELDAATRLGFVFESVAGYILPSPTPGAIPLYRLYSGTRGEHFYTTFAGERDAAVASGAFVSEGIAGYLPTF